MLSFIDMKLFWVLYFGSFLLFTSFGQASNEVTLDQAVQFSLAQGADQKILIANWQAAQALHQQNVAKAGLSVTSSVGYTATSGFGDNTLAVKLGAGVLPSSITYTSSQAPFLIPQNIQATVSASTPLTKATVSATQTLQANPNSTWSSTSQLGLSVTQTLWDGYPGGALNAAVDKSAITLQSSALTRDSNQLALVYKIKQAYYTLMAAQENLEVLQKTLDQRQSFLAILTAKHDLKQASDIDYKTAVVNAKSAEADKKAGEVALNTARMRLGLYMGFDPNQAFRVAPEKEPEIPASNIDEALKIALEKRSDLKALELSIRSSEIDEKLAWGQGQPNVSLTSSVNYLSDWLTQKSADSLSFGVKIGLPIYDSELIQNQTGASSIARTVAASQFDQLKKSIAIDLQDAFNQYQIKLERLTIAQLNVEALQAQSDILHVQFEYGTAKNSDVMTADVNLSTGQFALVQARINVWLAALLLQNTLGL